jgi:carbonic anhydrase
VKYVRDRHRAWLDTVEASRRVDALCELNVIDQAVNVCQTTVVQDAWKRGQELVVHGWFYGLRDGLLKDLTITVSSPEEQAAAYDRALLAVQLRYAPGKEMP